MDIKKNVILSNSIKKVNLLIGDSSYYIYYRKLIQSEFKVKIKSNNFDLVFKRLILIDSLYSTNQNKNRFALYDLAIHLSQYSDKELNLICLDFLKKFQNEKFINLFTFKVGEKGKKAQSLLSKYLFFLCDDYFPIYDSVVRANIYNEIVKFHRKSYKEAFPGEKSKEFAGFRFYVYMLKNMKDDLNVGFEQLDSYFWIKGKGHFGHSSNKIKEIKWLNNRDRNPLVKKSEVLVVGMKMNEEYTKAQKLFK